eukprot:333567-Amphidinium_carterae.2
MTCVRLISLTVAVHIWLRSKEVSTCTEPTLADAELPFVGALGCHDGEWFAYQDQHSYALDMSCGEGSNNDHPEEEVAEEGNQQKEKEARWRRADQWSHTWIAVSAIQEGIFLLQWMIRRPPYTPLLIEEEFEEKNTRRAATQGGRAATPSPQGLLLADKPKAR